VKAWVFASKDDQGRWTDQERSALPDLPTLVEVTHSGLNYKDALSLTRRAPISRRFPMVPGVDLVGRVIEDASGAFAPGDKVVATGWGLGETTWGAYAEEARLDPKWLLPVPANLDEEQAAAIGTAGVTAAMAIDALQRHGVAAGDGPVLVTGPTGGVGSLAMFLLAHDGYAAVAATGRPQEADFLTSLGASDILDRTELEGEPKPLGKERWRAGIDVVGGAVLANLLSNIQYGGAVAACGLAGSMNLPTSVAPFILRGVALLGVESVMAPGDVRRAAWSRISRAAAKIPFERLISRHRFSEVAELAPQLLEQKLRGRVVLSW
jgi:acrylyl-CoA reductase (NADPH)